MAKLLGGTRIYGTGTVDSQLFINTSTSAISTTSGALQVVGGAGIGGDLWLGGGNVNIVKSSTNLIMGDSNLTSTGTTNIILGRSLAGDDATIKTYAYTGTNLRIFSSLPGYHFDLSSYATTTSLPNGLATKQATLKAGSGITLSGATISSTPDLSLLGRIVLDHCGTDAGVLYL